MRSLILTSPKGERSDDFTVKFDPPIVLDGEKEYEVALVSASLWNSWYNITNQNNKFRYSSDGGRTFKTITLYEGAYNIDDINREIQRKVALNGDKGGKIIIEMHQPTLGVKLSLGAHYQVDFTVPNGFRNTLGFNSRIVTSTSVSDRPVDITEVTNLLFHCSLVYSTYVNDTVSDVIYTFTPNKPPGYLLDVTPPVQLYQPMAQRQIINQIRMRVTDQNENPIDLRGETVTYHLYIRVV